MMTYTNRTSKSCVFDAFEAAGLPVEQWMLEGARTDFVIQILQKNGYKIFTKENGSVEIPEGSSFFVQRDWKKDYGHLEFHVNTEGVLDYDSSSIAFIAFK